MEFLFLPEEQLETKFEKTALELKQSPQVGQSTEIILELTCNNSTATTKISIINYRKLTAI